VVPHGVSTPIVAYYVEGKGFGANPSHTLRAIGKPLFADSTSNYVIAFKKTDPNAETLRKEINQALLALKHDGTLKGIYQQWGLWNDLQQQVGIT
jgi:ABC-type amino acid transport substrate-binding protein